MPAPPRNITARHDGYKAQAPLPVAHRYRAAHSAAKFCYRNVAANDGMRQCFRKLIVVAGAGSIGCFVGGMLRPPVAASRCWRVRA